MNTFTKLSNLKIAVTGTRGFIGSHLLDELRRQNLSVIPIEGDVRCANTWNEDFDLLYHLAAPPISEYVSSPGEAFSVNLNGVLQALEACRKNNAMIIFTSSCSVYKPISGHALSEDQTLLPVTAYGRSKVIGEELCRIYCDYYKVKSIIFRLFNVYGQRQDQKFIIPFLIRCGLDKVPAKVKHPNSIRDFIYVADVVDALLRGASVEEDFSIFNIGSGKPFPVREVIEVISQALGEPISCKFAESDLDCQQSVYANIGFARKTLGWEPKISLLQGIRQIVSNITSIGLKE